MTKPVFTSTFMDELQVNQIHNKIVEFLPKVSLSKNIILFKESTKLSHPIFLKSDSFFTQLIDDDLSPKTHNHSNNIMTSYDWLAKNLILLSINPKRNLLDPKTQDVNMKTRSSSIKSRNPTMKQQISEGPSPKKRKMTKRKSIITST